MFCLLLFITFVNLFNLSLSSSAETNDRETFFNGQQRVVGGRFAKRGEFPFIIELLDKNEMHNCGGSLYNKWTVITAAHCVFDQYDENSTAFRVKRADELTLIAGQYSVENPDGTEQVRYPAQIHVPDERIAYPEENKFFFDIAIVILDSPFEINDNVRPIQLATLSEMDRATMARGIGWGKKSGCKPNNVIPSDILKTVHIPLLPDDLCPTSSIEQFVCMGARSQGLAGGDSGGPTVITVETGDKECVKLVGPNSAISDAAGCWTAANGPTIVTRAAVFNDFINEKAKGPAAGEC